MYQGLGSLGEISPAWLCGLLMRFLAGDAKTPARSNQAWVCPAERNKP
jgi:hypothetical protein